MPSAILTRVPWKVHRCNVTFTSVKGMWWQHSVVSPGWSHGKSTEVVSVERRSDKALSTTMFQCLHMHGPDCMRLSEREAVHVCVRVCEAGSETKKNSRAVCVTVVGPLYLTLHQRAAILWHVSLPGDLCHSVFSVGDLKTAPASLPCFIATW